MLSQILSHYHTPEGRFDELLAGPQLPRPHWARLMASLAQPEGLNISNHLALMEREIRENGITYNVYADPQGVGRLWDVDPLPLLLDASDWAQIKAGVAQRGALLNRVLGDIYGPQHLIRSGLLPPAVVFAHSGYLHQAQDMNVPSGVHLFHYAADLARAPNGQWWVVGDRTQAPSGVGYALENRWVISRVFPGLLEELSVQSLTPFLRILRDALYSLAPKSDAPPLICLLTPGSHNETYFEHTLLARQLGLALVEGHDLTVRDGRVWMKTVSGLQRVHALLRRQDDDYCDPLELRMNSALGVAGLADCARRGTVLIANALGSGVVESSALLGYLPRLCQHFMGEPLKLQSVATWWLGEPAALQDAWHQLDRLIVKPMVPSRNEPPVFGADLSIPERAALKARVNQAPQRYVAQEWVTLSQAPVLERAGPQDVLAPRSVGLRVFAVATPEGYSVMPGGLTRVAARAHSRIIAMQRGGRSKDTWVLSPGVANATLGQASMEGTGTSTDISGGPNPNPMRDVLASRVAENLFWLGRYSERCDACARLLRGAFIGLMAWPSGAPSPVLVFAQQMGLIEDKAVLPAALIVAATHADEGLMVQMKHLSRLGLTLRDRLSSDSWRALHQLMLASPGLGGSSDEPSPGSFSSTLSWLDRVVDGLMTLSGLMMNGMPRDLAWQFTLMGRHIERISNLCSALTVVIDHTHAQSFEWLLDWSDTTVYYRYRYMVAPAFGTVLDLLLSDATHPRSVAFQVQSLIAQLDALIRSGLTGHARGVGDVLTTAHAALQGLHSTDLRPDSETLLHTLEALRQSVHTVSDELTLHYFTHAASRSSSAPSSSLMPAFV